MFASLRIRTALVFLLGLSVPAVAGAATITLAWNANTEANIAGYRVHYGTQAGSYTSIIDRGNTLTASVTGLAEGTRYYFVVVAYDMNGGTSSFSAEVNDLPPPPIDSTPPVATMTAPAAGAQVSGSVALTAMATDNVAIAGVTFQVDGVAAGPEDTTAPYSFAWNTAGASNGAHALRAVARDSAGNLGTSPAITVQVLNDSTPPLILTLTPAANAANVGGATAVTARFNEPLNPSTVSAANFDLRAATTNALVTATVSYDAATRTARLVPAAPLTAGASFNATVRGGSTGIRDVAGNALATTRLWSFTVAQAPPPSTGLMAAYGFDEGTGTVAADASGNGNVGAISGTTWKPGKFGNSLEFDGLADWVTVAAGSDVNFTSALTIEAWVYPTTLTGWRTVMMKENGSALAYALYAHDNAPKPATYVRLEGASGSVGSADTVQLPLNTWTHLATTFDGTSLNLHVGGVLVMSQPASGAVTQSSGPLRLGGNAMWGEYFAGRIDEVRLYNRALSAAEIQADMSRAIVTANRLPVVTTPGPRTGTEGVAITALAISATDPDGDALEYAATGLPSGITIDADTGVIRGTVGFTATASNSVVVTVTDGRGGSASTAPFSWTITLVNRPPTVTTPGPQTGTEGFAVTPLAINAVDPDGDALTYSAMALPSGLAINAVTGVISGTVGASAAPANAVQVIVADGNGGSATASFNWTISSTGSGTGLVAAYGYDEGGGSVTADASGLGNTGTITGAAWTVGRFGKSLEFNGVSDWVTVAASAGVNVTAAMTLEAWVYPTEGAGWRTVAFKEAPGETWAHSYGLYSAFGSAGPGGHVLADSQGNAHDPAGLALNRWTHLAMTYDGQTVRSYVDGVERATVETMGPINVSAGALRIGGNDMWGDFFKGRIDEVRLYNRALPAAEIRQDMATPVTGWLAAAYSFDDGAGPTVADDSGRSLTGTVSGATWTTAGRFGGGLRFDGVNDSVTVADSSWLALEEDMTLEAWVYPTAPGGWRSVLMKQSAGWYTFALYSDGTVGPGVRAMTLMDGNATSPVALPVNEWSHLAATYDGATLRLFVNGVSVATQAYTGTLATSTDPLRIGGNAVFGEYFAGVIDEVRIYYRKLTGAEIRADMVRPIR